MSQAGRVIGIGVDIVEIARIRGSIDGFSERFLNKMFTPGEIADCQRLKDPAPSFAARFAAKEAVAKAFGAGIGQKMDWADIEIQRAESGAPICRLHGKARQTAAEMGVSQVFVSLSHSEHYAVANVLLAGA